MSSTTSPLTSKQTPSLTPQHYEVLHGGGAEAAEISQHRLSRRRFLRRSLFAVWAISATASVSGALNILYPNLTGQFDSILTVGTKADFPAAKHNGFLLNQAGVFYRQEAKNYIIYLHKDTQFSLQGATFTDQLVAETVVKDTDGSYRIGLYQRCVHLGCTVPFHDDCVG